MLRLCNSLGKRLQIFRPANPDVVTIFTCGPSVYQRAHIGNFRTFLFEDILVRYLRFRGYHVKRGMNFTDIEDKAVTEADKENLTVEELTAKNIHSFLAEMSLLKMLKPDYLPRASKAIRETVRVLDQLLEKGVAYRYGCDIYFDPLQFPGFGKIYGLDMSKWPKQKRRFSKDTYPGMRWNLGDFILWHGCTENERTYWKTKFGPGRPAWNIQDAVLVNRYFRESLSIYCGGIDNLVRHHDYSRAILESIHPYPMARYWLHCEHLFVNGQKMSKSKGNILYTNDLTTKGFSPEAIRFFLIDNHYRERINYSENSMKRAAARLAAFRNSVNLINRRAHGSPQGKSPKAVRLKQAFIRQMDNDLNVRQAVNAIMTVLTEIEPDRLSPSEAASMISTLWDIDRVLGILF